VCWFTKGSVGGIKCVAGAGVIVVESKQEQEQEIGEAQAESLRRIWDLHHVKLRFLRKVRHAQLTVRSSQRLRPNQIETDYHVHHPTHTPTMRSAELFLRKRFHQYQLIGFTRLCEAHDLP
jgi:hypothetical protein